MAIKPEDRYPGQINPGDTDYPYGSAKNVASPGSGDGTPLKDDWVNDDWGFKQKLLKQAGIIPTDNVDTVPVSQYFEALGKIARADIEPVIIKHDLVTPASKIVLEPGVAWDSTRAQILALDTALTKDLAAPWVVGNGNGGRAGALTADTWYHVFLIKHANGTVDAGFDTSITASNLLTASTYDYYRRVGSIYYETAAIRLFVQIGRDFLWDSPHSDTNAVPVVYTPVTLLTPPGVSVTAKIALEFLSSGVGFSSVGLKSPLQTNGAISTYAPVSEHGAALEDIITDVFSAIEYKYFNSEPTYIDINTLGWREFV